ncbi:MAG: glycosyltransferase family 2 protein, partial [Gemmatimonadaceae bacterium]
MPQPAPVHSSLQAPGPTPQALAPPDVSVLVPAKDEAENLPRFMEHAAEAVAADPEVRYEVVVIDDGSEDDSWAVLQELAARYPFLRLARHR